MMLRGQHMKSKFGWMSGSFEAVKYLGFRNLAASPIFSTNSVACFLAVFGDVR
jgi:hypothetical protein